MKKLSLIFLLFAFLFTHGEEVKIDKAKQVAINYLKNQNTSQLKSAREINLTPVSDLFYNIADNKLKSAVIDSSGLFIFNVNENQGFIVISGNDATIPVLAYGEEGKLEAGKVPDGLMFFLNSYAEQLKYLKNNPVDQSSEIKQIWDNLINETNLKSASNLSVKPLLNPPFQPDNHIIWGQSGFFNDGFKLVDIVNNKRAITGCVATAMAQVLKFNKWPKQGFGFHTYFHEQIGEINGDLSAIFGKTTYNWDEMPGIYDSNCTSNNIKAVSDLMLQCGRSVNMEYTLDKDGNALSLAPLFNTIHALVDHFGYSESMQFVEKQNYSELDWDQIIQTELDNKRLVLYGGFQLSGGGHAFICDGYEITNNSALYNFNWGWAGDGNDEFGNSYCTISALIPNNTTYNFSTRQHAIIDIKPKTFSYYDLKLDEFSYNDFIHGSSANIAIEVTNNGSNNFTGNICLAIFNKDDKLLVKIQEMSNLTINSGETKSLTFDYTKVNLLANNYTLGVFYKADGFNEVAINNGISNNFSNVIVKQYFQEDLVLNQPFTLSKNPIIQNTSFSVMASISNLGLLSFSGTIGLGIFDPSGIIKEIDEKKIENLTAAFSPWNITFQSGGLDILPGNYLFGIYQKTDLGEIIFINPIENSTEYLNVIAPPVIADIYEPNNTPTEAAILTLPENSVSLTVYGGTIHNISDIDFFRLNLQEGYNYKIKANVYDLNNPKAPNKLTCDVVCQYSYNSTWTQAYDDFGGNILVPNGGDVLFAVAPKDEGMVGSYILEIIVQKEVNLAGIEYFWDNKDGLNGFIASINSSDETFNFNIPLNNIATGLHRLYFRTKDSQGKWSTIHSKPVLVTTEQANTTITKLEYFIDEKPETGIGIPLNFTEAKDVSVSKNLSLADVAPGLHRIYFRAKDKAGRWSPIHSKPILVTNEKSLASIKKIEYFFDEPTAGVSANTLSFTPSTNVTVSQQISTNGIETGLHRLYFKAQDETGRWSALHSKPVLINNSSNLLPDISYLEYFFDTDPELRQGTSIPFTSTADITVNPNIPLAGISYGTHTVFFRAKDNMGRWSIPQSASFEKVLIDGLNLQSNVMLEAAYKGTSQMINTVHPYIPLVQPYSVSPWNYSGSETVTSIPSEIVDWVLVELRQAVSPDMATSATILAKRAAFLKSDGSVVDLDGTSPVQFDNSVVESGNNLYVVIRHRNHLAVMSATGATLNNGVYSFDFTTGLDQAFGGGNGY